MMVTTEIRVGLGMGTTGTRTAAALVLSNGNSLGDRGARCCG